MGQGAGGRGLVVKVGQGERCTPSEQGWIRSRGQGWWGGGTSVECQVGGRRVPGWGAPPA